MNVKYILTVFRPISGRKSLGTSNETILWNAYLFDKLRFFFMVFQ